MGRKDSYNRGSNLETYRKRIGKQEYHRTKGAVRSIKDTSDAKQSALGIKEVLLVMLAIFITLSSVYLIFIYSFSK